MKIAIVFDGLGFGGIERVGIDYIKLLLELGHNVDVINLTPMQLDLEKEIPKECIIKHINFPRKFAPEYYAKLIKMFWWGKYVYPVVYLILKVLCTIYRIKNSVSNKYDIAIAFSGHFNDLTYVAENIVRSDKKVCWLHGALYGYFLISDGFVNLYKKIKNLVVLVDDAQEEVLMYNGFLKLNIKKMYNPTFIKDKEINYEEVKELKNKYGEFGIMVARFSYPHKDHYTVVDAVKLVNDRYNKNFKILFIGDGPDMENVKTYCERNGTYNKSIFFEGAKYNVQDYFKAATILVHASVAGEGLPTVMLEALSFGLPMVVTDSKVGPREILGDNRYGLLSKVKDSEDMAYKIKQLLDNAEEYEKYRNLSQERIKAFLPMSIKKELVEFLKSLQ